MIKRFFILIGELFLYTVNVLKKLRPPIYASETIDQMKKIGVDSLPMAALTGFFIGLITALQVGRSIESIVKGTVIYIGGLIAISMVKEMGPIFTGIVLISRSGSAVTAHLASMKISEQIDALKVMSIDPIKYLVIPRFIAFSIMHPVLNTFTICSGMLGGALIAQSTLGVSSHTYWSKAVNILKTSYILESVSKSFVLGATIAIISTFFGINVKRGAEEVGKATTMSVVISTFGILLMDYLFGAISVIIRGI